MQYAELLPPPLYVIYSQLMAQKEAFGENVELEIVGSVKDAQAVARQQANKDTGWSQSIDFLFGLIMCFLSLLKLLCKH